MPSVIICLLQISKSSIHLCKRVTVKYIGTLWDGYIIKLLST